jgi:hypothetical protein
MDPSIYYHKIYNVNLDGCPMPSSLQTPCVGPHLVTVFEGNQQQYYDLDLPAFTGML